MKHCLVQLFLAFFLYIDIYAEIIPRYDIETDLRHSRTNCYSNSAIAQALAPLFIPSENDSIMTVRLNLIFIQKDDGTGNFQQNDSEHQIIIDDAMNILNNTFMSSLVMPGTDCFSGSESEIVHDTRIRFNDHRYYIRNSALWDNNLSISGNNLCPGSSNWYLTTIDDSLNNVLDDSMKGINIYFTEDATLYHRCWEVQDLNDTTKFGSDTTNAACSMFPSFYNLNGSSRLHMPCQYSKYWWVKNIVPQLESEHNTQWLYNGRLLLSGSIASELAHELGHSFNLHHPSEDLSHVIYPNTGCIATIMQPSRYSPRNFLPPNEIGKMYFCSMTSNLQQFIPTDTYLGTKTFNTTISLPQMRMYYSLLIGVNGNVSLPCNITFSPQGYIKIQNGGVLSVNNALLQSIQDSWGGIIVQSGGQLLLSDITIGDYNIVVQSGGKLVVRNDLTVMGNHSIKIENGGYLCINSDASINLVNEFSSIIVSPNAILGCSSCSEDCILTRSGLTNIGDGHFITYEGTDFVQDTTILSDYMATGNAVYVGYDVTTTKPFGKVVIENGGELRVKANTAILKKEVEVKVGGKLIINP